MSASPQSGRARGALRDRTKSGALELEAGASTTILVKIDVHLSIDDRLRWQHFRRRIPGLLLQDAVLDRFCDQSSDLFTLQRDQSLIAVILVKLRTIIQSMDPRVVSFNNEEVLGSKKNIVLCDYFLFQGG